MDPLARDFVRYRERGDVDALGAVFDAVAARLVSLAQLLAGNATEAEDLVQTTFLLAIKKAEQFDAGRPLVPWLCGILEGEARNLRRRRASRRTVDLGPRAEAVTAPVAGQMPEPAALEPGPAAVAERHELVATVRRHVERLPREQRQVMLLRLQHGLEPIEVAEVLGLPPGTVRMRLHRGLEALRRWLPASLSALAVFARPARGLAQVRVEVVRAGARRAVVLLGGGMVVHKWLAAAAAFSLLLVGLGGALALTWNGDAAAPDANRPAAASGALATAASPSAEMTAVGAPDDSVRQTLPSAAHAADPGTTSGTLRIDVVAYERGDPMPYATAVAAPVGGDGDPELTRYPATADAAGVLRWSLPAGTYDVAVHCGGHVEAVIRSGLETRLGTDIMVGNPARGVVRLPDGRPAAGAAIVMCNEGDVFSGGVADAAGRFDLRAVHPFHLVGARLPGYAPSALQSLSQDGDLEIELPGPAAVVVGSVVDENGAPIAAARVAMDCQEPPEKWVAKDGRELHRGGSAVLETDAGGAFRCETGAGRQRVRVAVPGRVTTETFVAAAFGVVSTAKIVVPRGERVDGIVVDTAGEPLRDVRVHLGSRDGPARTTGADGRFRFAAASAGELVAFCDGDALESARVVRAAGVCGEWRIALQRWPAWSFRFVDEAGEALAHQLAGMQWGDGGAFEPTDADGRVTLHAPTAVAAQLELVQGDRKQRTILPWPVEAAPGRETTVVVSRRATSSARLRGRLAAADGSVGGLELQLVPATGAAVTMRGWTDDDGAFELTSAPGDQTLIVRGDGDLALARFPIALAAAEERDLGVLELPAGGQLELAPTLPGGAVPFDVVLAVIDAAGGEARLPFAIATSRPWPVGDFRYRLESSNACWCCGTFVVRQGAITRLSPELTPAVQQRLLVPAAADLPSGPANFEVTAPDGGLCLTGRWDPLATGALELTMPLTVGTWRVAVRWPAGRSWCGAVGFDGVPLAAPLRFAAVAPR